MKETREKTVEGVLYKAGIGLLLGLPCIWLISRFIPASWRLWELPCFFHVTTGLYCPGCGGSRAIRALLGGRLLESLYYHPLVLYAAAWYVIFMGSQTLMRVTGGAVRGITYRHRYLAAGGILVLLHVLIKNAALIFWNVPFMA